MYPDELLLPGNLDNPNNILDSKGNLQVGCKSIQGFDYGTIKCFRLVDTLGKLTNKIEVRGAFDLSEDHREYYWYNVTIN